VPRSLHHAALVVHDLDQSLRFYRDGVGLVVLTDHSFAGDWPTLFDAPAETLRSVFLGDPDRPHAGIVELVVFETPASPGVSGGASTAGFFLLSFFVDVPETLIRLDALGLGGPPRRIEHPGPGGPVAMATVRDPDGILVELIQAGSAGA
jgi:catechol 2,3-dioxygenase-like lactoylglutathione lyase family enzyme